MVYIRDDPTEEVTDVRDETRNGVDGVLVETEDGYFEYWFPLIDAPEFYDGSEDLVLDPMAMRIRENGTPPSTYKGTSSLTVPSDVADQAEQFSGVPVLE